MIEQQLQNNAKFKYILGDSWFSSRDNMKFVESIDKTFIFEIKNDILATTNERGQFEAEEPVEVKEQDVRNCKKIT
ncbi:hypothetical protein FACS1894152_7810 [Bacilli bacterium]|nr:hypothetical protein FACS1894152_7810 [Bacilli bacterium]